MLRTYAAGTVCYVHTPIKGEHRRLMGRCLHMRVYWDVPLHGLREFAYGVVCITWLIPLSTLRKTQAAYSETVARLAVLYHAGVPEFIYAPVLVILGTCGPSFWATLGARSGRQKTYTHRWCKFFGDQIRYQTWTLGGVANPVRCPS